MNMNLKQRKKPNMDCINLLTSILLCYPEISEISVEPEHEEVYISYTVDRILNDEDLSQTREFLEDSILSYQYLENLVPEKNDIVLEVREKATFINITRDVKTFSHGELRLLNEIVKDRFAKNLISEPDKVPLVDTGILSQLELIDAMLGSLKINPVEEKMVGIRENGRVIVYNK